MGQNLKMDDLDARKRNFERNNREGRKKLLKNETTWKTHNAPLM